MKKNFILAVLLMPTLLFAAPIEKVAETVFSLPEAKELYQEVSTEGRVSFRFAPFRTYANSNAMWRGWDRTVVLNSNKHRSLGQWVVSLLFELHNAKANKQFAHLDRLACQGRISKAQYVEGVERIEHNNALQTKKLLAKGIQAGLYPYDATWPIPSDFQTHFSIQKQAGHSSQIAAMFDNLTR